MRFLLLLSLIASFFVVMPVRAEGKLPRDQVEVIAKKAHGLLGQAKIGNGEPIGEEKAKTLQYPLVSYELIEFIVMRGHIAGFAAHCQLDWQNKFYIPMMGFLRSRHKDFNDYQWAYVSMLHGVAMGGAESAVKDEPCSADMKAKLSAEGK